MLYSLVLNLLLTLIFLIMCKSIALEKLNGVLVNVKAVKALKDFNKKNPHLVNIEKCETGVHLVQLVLRVPLLKKRSNKPFVAFIKHAGELAVIVDVETGSTQVVDPTVIASETEIQDTFSINDTLYGLKDTVNGFKRYHPLAYKSQKPRQRLTPISSIIVNALADDEEDAIEEEFEDEFNIYHER